MTQTNARNYSTLTYDELSDISTEDHRRDSMESEKQEGALSFVVIGGILLIIGFIFFLLSFKRVKNKMAGIDLTGLPFIITCLCIVASLTLLIIGITRYLKAHKVRKALREEISIVAKYKDKLIKKEAK